MTETYILVVRKYGDFSKNHRLSYHLNMSRKVCDFQSVLV